MDYLNQNLKKMQVSNKTVYKVLIDLLSEVDKNNYRSKTKYRIIETKDCRRTIEICYNNGLEKARLNSVYNSEREAIRWSERYNSITHLTSLIMFGYGNGIIYNQIKKKLDLSARVFIYEPDRELFLFLMTNFDMSDILNDKRVTFYIEGINSENLYIDLCDEVNWSMLPTQLVCFHPMYNEIYKKSFESFELIIDQYKYALELGKNTSLYCSKEYTINIIKNLEFVKKSNYVTELIDKIDKCVPVIIVSAGPSLDKNILELKKARKKAFILATDTAVRYLVKEDVWFDAIVTIDGSKPEAYLNGEECNDKCLFVIPDSNNEILKKNNGRKIWMNGSGLLENLYCKYGLEFPKYESGGSVATAAFWIAKVLKVHTIILVGQDLAYEGENTHAGKTIDIPNIDNKNDIYVDGIYETKVKTRWDWLRYKQWFENVIVQLENNVEVIDATEGGAKIEGTKIMKLSEAIDNKCKNKFDFSAILDNIVPTFSSEKYKKIYSDMRYILYQFDTILNASDQGVKITQKVMSIIKINHVDSDKLSFYLQYIKDLQRNIQKQEIYILLDEYISADVEERIFAANRRYNDENIRLYENMKSNKILFEALIKAVKELKPFMIEVLAKSK